MVAISGSITIASSLFHRTAGRQMPSLELAESALTSGPANFQQCENSSVHRIPKVGHYQSTSPKPVSEPQPPFLQKGNKVIPIKIRESQIR